MTTHEKLDFIQRAIVTAGGPDPKGMSEDVYLITLTAWLMYVGADYTDSKCDKNFHAARLLVQANRDCGCKGTTDGCKKP